MHVYLCILLSRKLTRILFAEEFVFPEKKSTQC